MNEDERFEYRARDAVAQCLIRQLTVPNIYLDAHWPSQDHHIDVLAVDRAGSGDIHVVKVTRRAADMMAELPHLLSVPAPYRWIAFPSETIQAIEWERLQGEQSPLVAAHGGGRVGAIEIVRMAGKDWGANAKVRPERFPGSDRRATTEFVSRTDPDIQVDSPIDGSDVTTTYSSLQEPLFGIRLTEVRQLLEGGHTEAAFVMGWAVAEAAMRVAAQREGLRLEGTSPLALVRSLHSVGLIDMQERDFLTEAGQLRNAVAHGFSVDRPLPTERLIDATERILTARLARQGA